MLVDKFDGREAKKPSTIRKFVQASWHRFCLPMKQYILNTHIDIFVKLMKYIYWQVQARVTLCDSFYTSRRIKLQDKTMLANVARPSPAV